MIRDDEIKRLIKYAEGLGTKVVISSADIPDSAAWTTDGSRIEIYKKSQRSKTELILSLIHEIGHHLWFIHERDRNPDLKFDEALDRQNFFEEDVYKTPPPKKMREKIYKVERDSAEYWEIIYKDTGLKIPIWKLQVAKELDVWIYEVYYQTGHFPSAKAKLEKKKELVKKYKNK